VVPNLVDLAQSGDVARVSDVGVEWPGLPAEYCEARWYAAYTRPNHEKRVAEQLGLRQVEHFLPTYCSLRRWKDRRVRLDLPLFPAYVFLRLALRDRLRVLEIPSLVRLVGFSRVPTALPADEVETLRSGLTIGVRAEPHPYLTAGRRVRVKSGPLVGLMGILLKRKSAYRVVLSIELIQRSVAVHVDLSDIELVE
jgi:transcription antitermination factor NusG